MEFGCEWARTPAHARYNYIAILIDVSIFGDVARETDATLSSERSNLSIIETMRTMGRSSELDSVDP